MQRVDNPPYLCFCDFEGILLISGCCCCVFALQSLPNLFVFIPNTPLLHRKRKPAARYGEQKLSNLSSSGDELNHHCVTQSTIENSRHLFTRKFTRFTYKSLTVGGLVGYMCKQL